MCPAHPGKDRRSIRLWAQPQHHKPATGLAVAGVADLLLSERADMVRLVRWRHELAEWLEAAGGDPDLVETVVLAVNEAVTNAVEHAYRDRPPGEVTLRARVGATPADPERSGVVVEVADDGQWQPVAHEATHRGCGLAMIGALADRVDRALTAAGTTITMSWVVGPTGR